MKPAKLVSKNRSKTKKKIRNNQSKTNRSFQQQNIIQPQIPLLRFTPYAWAKLLFLRDLGDSEVGGFGISAADDLLLIEDIQLIKQHCTSVTVKFDDESVADFFDEQVDQGRQPEQFGRIWIHTHPGASPSPSAVDEETFVRSFGSSDWAMMFIIAQQGATYSRLRFNTGPGGEVELPVRVDFSTDFPAADHASWEQEYLTQVTITDDWAILQQPTLAGFDPYGLNDLPDEEAFWTEDDLFVEPGMTGFLDDDFEWEEEQL